MPTAQEVDAELASLQAVIAAATSTLAKGPSPSATADLETARARVAEIETQLQQLNQGVEGATSSGSAGAPKGETGALGGAIPPADAGRPPPIVMNAPATEKVSKYSGHLCSKKLPERKPSE